MHALAIFMAHIHYSSQTRDQFKKKGRPTIDIHMQMQAAGGRVRVLGDAPLGQSFDWEVGIRASPPARLK
jgi:hypothetical protein